MQRMTWQQQRTFERARPASLDEAQIEVFIRPVNLVPNDRMAQGREMHADLMRPPGSRHGADETEPIAGCGLPKETPHDVELSESRCTRGMDHLF